MESEWLRKRAGEFRVEGRRTYFFRWEHSVKGDLAELGQEDEKCVVDMARNVIS